MDKESAFPALFGIACAVVISIIAAGFCYDENMLGVTVALGIVSALLFLFLAIVYYNTNHVWEE